jgi:hypothetical protein
MPATTNDPREPMAAPRSNPTRLEILNSELTNAFGSNCCGDDWGRVVGVLLAISGGSSDFKRFTNDEYKLSRIQ